MSKVAPHFRHFQFHFQATDSQNRWSVSSTFHHQLVLSETSTSHKSFFSFPPHLSHHQRTAQEEEKNNLYKLFYFSLLFVWWWLKVWSWLRTTKIVWCKKANWRTKIWFKMLFTLHRVRILINFIHNNFLFSLFYFYLNCSKVFIFLLFSPHPFNLRANNLPAHKQLEQAENLISLVEKLCLRVHDDEWRQSNFIAV